MTKFIVLAVVLLFFIGLGIFIGIILTVICIAFVTIWWIIRKVIAPIDEFLEGII